MQGITIDAASYEKLHETYKEPLLTHRRFKHQDIDSLVKQHQQRAVLSVDSIGKSVEKRNIYHLTYGEGKTKVMLWSQMHGDEPTATMALFDLFNFLEGRDDDYDAARKLIKEKLNIHFIPMLNPDGAERYMRRNAQFVDLNRDARAAQTVEAALLKQMAQKITPRYAFNLHDQSIYYNVPGTKNPVAISLLAPAYNLSREVNEVRKGAMQLIVGMNKLLQQYIPDAVAKYDDTYSPRGFGDNFQSWGASTVLIESGGISGDPEKQQIRKLNFIIILNALLEIAQEQYKLHNDAAYEQIPFNDSQLHDVVIRNVDLGTDSTTLVTDVAIRRSEVTVGRDFYARGRVEDIGDLQDFYGYDDIDAQGMEFIQGKTLATPYDSVAAITMDEAWRLLKNGFIAVRVKDVGASRLHQLPLVVFTQQRFEASPEIVINGYSNFFLGKGNTVKYAVVNGYLLDLSKKPTENYYKNRIN